MIQRGTRIDVHLCTAVYTSIPSKYIVIIAHVMKTDWTWIYKDILFVFHDSFVKSVMTIDLIYWWGNLSVKERDNLNRICTISCKNTGCCTSDTSLEQLYKWRTPQMVNKILSDPTHFWHDQCGLLLSGRRYRMSIVRTQCALKSFIPCCLSYLFIIL